MQAQTNTKKSSNSLSLLVSVDTNTAEMSAVNYDELKRWLNQYIKTACKLTDV